MLLVLGRRRGQSIRADGTKQIHSSESNGTASFDSKGRFLLSS